MPSKNKLLGKVAKRGTKKLKRALERDPPKVGDDLLDRGDPNAIKRHDSFTECRKCLEPGIARECCGNFYCNECFCA